MIAEISTGPLVRIIKFLLGIGLMVLSDTFFFQWQGRGEGPSSLTLMLCYATKAGRFSLSVPIYLCLKSRLREFTFADITAIVDGPSLCKMTKQAEVYGETQSTKYYVSTSMKHNQRAFWDRTKCLCYCSFPVSASVFLESDPEQWLQALSENWPCIEFSARLHNSTHTFNPGFLPTW